MKAPILILFLALAALSCKDNDKGPKSCGYSDPTVMPWLKAKIKEVQNDPDAYLVQGEYNGSPIFYFGTCCAACDVWIRYFDCNGEEVTFPINIRPQQNVTNTKVIWQPENGTCSFTN